MARQKRINTKLEIVQVATELFLENGYTNVTISHIADEIGISKGNLTFHFPTKENILAELIKRLSDFQWKKMGTEVAIGHTSLIAYLFEITAMAGSCYENPIAKDLYVSAFTSPLSLRIVREAATKKAKQIFAPYRPDWTDTDYILAGNIVSGIEYAIFTTERQQEIALGRKISGTLNTIMKIYNVPKDVRDISIQKVLEMDYYEMGHRMLNEFYQYVEEVNQKALEQANNSI